MLVSGKIIVVFATSGGSGIERTADKLRLYINEAKIIDAQVIRTVADAKERADRIRI